MAGKEKTSGQFLTDTGKRGPLGGMHACFSVMDTPYALVLPVDVPQISISVLQTLLDAHGRLLNKNHQEYVRPLLLSHGERTEPLIGIYPAMLGRKIGAIIEKSPLRYSVSLMKPDTISAGFPPGNGNLGISTLQKIMRCCWSSGKEE